MIQSLTRCYSVRAASDARTQKEDKMLCLQCQQQYELSADRCPSCGKLSPETLDHAKRGFLEYVQVGSECLALRNALQAAMRHSGTYRRDALESQKEIFRRNFKKELSTKGDLYQEQITDAQHIRVLEEVSNKLSIEHGAILHGSRLRLGIAQKALNLYLKFLWCLDSSRATPPHCPIDRMILQSAGVYENWTELDSIEKYSDWIEQLRSTAAQAHYSCLSEWELRIWG